MKLLDSIVFAAGVFISAFSSLSSASQYDHCEQVFVGGKFNTAIGASSESSSFAMKLWLCNQAQRTQSNSESFDSAASYAGLFDGDGSYSKSRFDEWKQSACMNLETANTSSKRTYMYRQVADAETIKVWERCVAGSNNDLVCWATPIDDLFVLNVKSPAGTANGYKSLAATLANATLQSEFPTTVDESSTKQVIGSRQNTDQSSIILVAGVANSNNQQADCSVVIPPVPKPVTLATEQTSVNLGPGVSWTYRINFSDTVIVKSGKITIGEYTFDITPELTKGISSQYIGSFSLSLESTSMTEVERQAWYWEAHSILGCDNLSCNNGYIERKWRDVLADRNARNNSKSEAHSAGVSATLSIVDTRNRIYSELVKVQ